MYLNAGALLLLIRTGTFGPHDALDAALVQATQNFKAWRRLHKVRAAIPAFTRSRLGLTSDEPATMKLKAYNGRVCTAWLADVACKAAAASQDAGLHQLTATVSRARRSRARACAPLAARVLIGVCSM